VDGGWGLSTSAARALADDVVAAALALAESKPPAGLDLMVLGSRRVDGTRNPAVAASGGLAGAAAACAARWFLKTKRALA
jgi:hypothetical protein